MTWWAPLAACRVSMSRPPRACSGSLPLCGLQHDGRQDRSRPRACHCEPAEGRRGNLGPSACPVPFARALRRTRGARLLRRFAPGNDILGPAPRDDILGLDAALAGTRRAREISHAGGSKAQNSRPNGPESNRWARPTIARGRCPRTPGIFRFTPAAWYEGKAIRQGTAADMRHRSASSELRPALLSATDAAGKGPLKRSSDAIGPKRQMPGVWGRSPRAEQKQSNRWAGPTLRRRQAMAKGTCVRATAVGWARPTIPPRSRHA